MNYKIKIATAAFAGIMGLSKQAPATAADQSSEDEDIKLLRKDIRSLKKQIIAENLELTEAEAQQFWPIYDRYTAEMVKIFDQKFDAIKKYSDNYDSLTDEQADAYIKGRASAEESLLQLRLKYIPVFRKILSGKTAARFIQLDWRLGLIADLQLAALAPIIEP
jgi:Spy/CpxP family protein refolding chaperone